MHTAAALVLGGELLDVAAGKEILQSCRPIIACDGGADHLIRMDIQPDIFIGDCDSVSEETLNVLALKNIPRYVFPERKDLTDSELGFEFLADLRHSALNMKTAEYDDKICRKDDSQNMMPLIMSVQKISAIYLVAAFGNRPDHVLMNQIICAKHCTDKFAISMTDGVSWQWFAKGPYDLRLSWPNHAAAQKAEREGYDFAFSAMALDGNVTGLSYHAEGEVSPSYPLSDATLEQGISLGVSNYAVDRAEKIALPNNLKISWKAGTLAISVIPNR